MIIYTHNKSHMQPSTHHQTNALHHRSPRSPYSTAPPPLKSYFHHCLRALICRDETWFHFRSDVVGNLLSLRLTDSQVTYLTDWRPQRGRLLKRIVHGTSSDRHESQSQSFIKSIYRPNKCICANAQLTLFPKRSLNRLKDYSLVTDGVGPSFACNFLASEGKAIVSLHRRSVQFLLNGDDEASPLVDS